MSNTDLWDRVCKTDPNHVKPITGKQYSGNSPKPYYIVRRLTEEFGPCGTGWGFDIISERMERMSDTDILHIAQIEFWYGSEGAKFQQMGQTKAAYMTSSGKLLVDEDAPKKSVTDALVKCASYLGFAGDIFSGRWDDSKYVAALKKEFAEDSLVPVLEASIEQEKQKRAGVMAAVLPAIEAYLDGPTKTALSKLAFELGELYKQPGGSSIAYIHMERQELNGDEKTYLASMMDSKLRAALKRERDTRAMTKEHA